MSEPLCLHCRGPMPPPTHKRGRPKSRFCSGRCRRRAETRQRMADEAVGRLLRRTAPDAYRQFVSAR